MMRRALALGLLSLHVIVSLGCGGTVVFEQDDGAGGGSTASSSDDVAAGPSAATSGAGGEGTTTNVAVSASAGAGGFSGTAIEPSVVAVTLGASCMPKIGPDPIQGVIQVRYDNVGAEDGSLDGMRAQLIFSSEVEGWVFPLVFDPSTSGIIPGGSGRIRDHLKVATDGDSSFVCSLCSLQGTLVLGWTDADGGEVTTSAPVTLGCAL